jgi:hypothetical protein
VTDLGRCVRQLDMTREKRDHLVACLTFLLLCTVGVAAARSDWSAVAVLSGVIVLGLGALARWMPATPAHHPARAATARRSDR